MTMFEVKVKDIHYHNLLKIDARGSPYQRKLVEQEKKIAMREFLTFFLKKRTHIISKINENKSVQKKVPLSNSTNENIQAL